MKCKFDPPTEVQPYLSERYREEIGKTSSGWTNSQDLIDLGWLVEVKEPLTRDDVRRSMCYPDESHDTAAFNTGWKLGRENLLLEQENENN